ncbi:unnamed protein product [Dicrocoelium dendriticum]|nr:unnamed protein product [Dicrocoelium dendriticum]
MKAMQRELDAKTTRLGILEATQYSLSGRMDAGVHTPTGSNLDASQLRRTNHELTLKVAQLQLDLDDRERQLRAVERMHTTVGVMQGNDFSEMAVLR